MNKYLKNQRGSAMVLIVMVMSILTILGSALVTISTTNYKMRHTNLKSKKTFYYAESGLEEAYGILFEKIDNIAIKEAKEEAKKVLENVNKVNIEKEVAIYEENEKIEKENVKLKSEGKETKELLQHFKIEDLNSTYPCDQKIEQQNLVDKDGNINWSGVEAKRDVVFDAVFIEKLKDVVNGLKNADLKNSYKIFKEDKENLNLTFEFVDISELGNSEMYKICDVKSNFNLDGITREVKTSFKIKKPKYSDSYALTATEVNKNKMSKSALIAGQDLDIRGNLNVDGVMYVGNNTNLYSSVTFNKTGKFNVGGNLNFNGTVKNMNYNLNKTKEEGLKEPILIMGDVNISSQGSKIDINEDILTYKSILFNDDAKSVKLNSKDMYVFDDFQVETEATYVEAKVEGSYYGLNQDANHGNSSSIIINSDQILNGEATNPALNVTDEVLISGVSFIEGLSFGDYQTGESISYKGNYKAYVETSIDSILNEYIETLYPDLEGKIKEEKEVYITEGYNEGEAEEKAREKVQDEINESLKELKYFLNEKSGESITRDKFYSKYILNENKFEKNLVFSDESEETNLNIRFADKIAEKELDALNRAKLFEAYYDINKEIKKKNDEFKTNLSNVGIQVSSKDNIDASGFVLFKTNQGEGAFVTDEHTKLNKNEDKKNEMNNYKNIEFKGIVKNLSEMKSGNVRFDFDAFLNYNNKLKNTDGEIVLIDDSYKNYLIVEEGKKEEYQNKVPKDVEVVEIKKLSNINKTMGLIVTKGNLYFGGDIDITGTIISEGKITILNGSDVNITDSSKVTSRLAAKHKVTNIFKKGETSETEIVIGMDDINNESSKVDRNQLIQMYDWRLIK